jgi:hypothetical protein
MKSAARQPIEPDPVRTGGGMVIAVTTGNSAKRASEAPHIFAAAFARQQGVMG